MIGYMLDTNAFSHVAANPNGRVARRVLGVETPVGVSAIVVAEIAYGLAWRPNARRDAQIAAILNEMTIVEFDRDAAEHYGRIRADLQTKGTPIGGNDLFIAAHARALNAVLVTRNVREFARVPGLRVENWEMD